MTNIIQYLTDVERSLTRKDSPVLIKNSLFPLKMLIQLHSDQLLESETLKNLNQSIESYIIHCEVNDMDNEENSEILAMLKDILSIKLEKPPMCTGRNNEMQPHRADPTLFAKRGLCADCLPEDGSPTGVKKGAKKAERSDTFRENILKCIEEVLEGYDKKDLEKFLNSEEVTNGEQLYQKLKSISMSKTEGNWTKLRDKIQRDIIKLGTAYGVNVIAYVFHPTLKKLDKLGQVRDICKENGWKQSPEGTLINSFLIAEEYLTGSLMNAKTEPKPTRRQACEATKVIKSLSAVGVANLLDKKAESKFENTQTFCVQYEKWMDELEKDGEIKDGRNEAEEVDYDKDSDVTVNNSIMEGEQFNQDQDENDDLFVNERLFNGIVDDANLQVARSLKGNQYHHQGIGMEEDGSADLTIYPSANSNPSELLNGRIVASNNIKSQTAPVAAYEFVNDENVSLMASYTEKGRDTIKDRKLKLGNKKLGSGGENGIGKSRKREGGQDEIGFGKILKSSKDGLGKIKRSDVPIGDRTAKASNVLKRDSTAVPPSESTAMTSRGESSAMASRDQSTANLQRDENSEHVLYSKQNSERSDEKPVKKSSVIVQPMMRKESIFKFTANSGHGFAAKEAGDISFVNAQTRVGQNFVNMGGEKKQQALSPSEQESMSSYGYGSNGMYYDTVGYAQQLGGMYAGSNNNGAGGPIMLSEGGNQSPMQTPYWRQGWNY